jgi:hypothetical protein
MKKLLGLTLGIMTALGGVVDLSQIVFTMQRRRGNEKAGLFNCPQNPGKTLRSHDSSAL